MSGRKRWTHLDQMVGEGLARVKDRDIDQGKDDVMQCKDTVNSRHSSGQRSAQLPAGAENGIA